MQELVKLNKVTAKTKKGMVYTDLQAVITPGEVVGLFGHNGAGKTTLLRQIANVDYPFSGEIYVDGKLNDINEYQPNVVLIPDEIKLLKDSTIKTNFELITGNYDVDVDYFERCLHTLDLKDEVYVGSLSKGNQEILQLMIYFSINTKVYLLDEPFSAVDIFRRQLIQKLLIDLLLRNEEASIIITTHLIDDVEQIIDRILYLDFGRFVIDGQIEELTEGYEKLTDFFVDYFKEGVGFNEFV